MSNDLYHEGCAWIDGDVHADFRGSDSHCRLRLFPLRRHTTTSSPCGTASFFRLDDHLARFESSWRRLRMSPPLTLDEMRAILFECVRRSGLRHAYVEMILSRGVPPPGVPRPAPVCQSLLRLRHSLCLDCAA